MEPRPTTPSRRRLTKVTLSRPRGRRRTVRLTVVATEAVDVRVRLARSGAVLLSKEAAIKSGSHTIAMPIGDGVEAGPARLEVLFTDADGNHRKVNHRIVLRGAR